jgi:hypothetical protein
VDFVKIASYAILARLEARCATSYRRLERRVQELRDKLSDQSLCEFRSLLDEALRICSMREKEVMRASSLQAKRLNWLSACAVVVFLLLLALSPALVNQEPLKAWPVKLLPFKVTVGSHVVCWSCAMSMMIMGVAGGIISGLLRTRDMTVQLWQYRESGARLLLKPVLGGTAALLVFILFSWKVIWSSSLENPGAYLLVAFLCGFSERFFEDLLQSAEERLPATAEVVALDAAAARSHG